MITSVEIDIPKKDYKFLRTKNVQTYLGILNCSATEAELNYAVDWSASGESKTNSSTFRLKSYPLDVQPTNILAEEICVSVTADGYSLYSAWSEPKKASLL